MPDPELWFHLPNSHRLGITIVLLFNCLFQFANQGTRFYFYDYEKQDEVPGNIWTNVFFVSSFACAASGGGWMAWEAGKVRQAHTPGQFGPGPLETLKLLFAKYVLGKKDVEIEGGGSLVTDVQGGGGCDQEPDAGNDHEHEEYVDPTRFHHGSILRENDRAALRMWGM